MKKFIESIEGNVDLSFWNSIMTIYPIKSNLSYPDKEYLHVGGWIKHFFGGYDMELTSIPSSMSSASVNATDLTNQMVYKLLY